MFTLGCSPDPEGAVGLQHDDQPGVVLEEEGGHGQALPPRICTHIMHGRKDDIVLLRVKEDVCRP